MNRNAHVFVISIAAELAGMHPQTLRQYDRLGLVSPSRTPGRSRRYSLRDIEKLREVARLSSEGVGLEGIKRILDLEDRVSDLTTRVAELQNALAQEMLRRPGRRVFAAGTAAGEITSLHKGTRVRRSTQVVVWQPRAHGPRDQSG